MSLTQHHSDQTHCLRSFGAITQCGASPLDLLFKDSGDPGTLGPSKFYSEGFHIAQGDEITREAMLIYLGAKAVHSGALSERAGRVSVLACMLVSFSLL